MPRTKVIFYKERSGVSPAYEAIEAFRRSGQLKALAKCHVRIARLAEKGYELRRPEADYLRDGIYELRATHQRVHHRILYFFHDRRIAVLSHLITKEEAVPDAEIDRAVARKRKFQSDPERHTLRAT